MPAPTRKKLGEALVEAGLIDELQLRSALADQKRWGNRLGKTLIKLGFVEEVPLMRHLSKLLGYPLAEIRGREVATEVLALLPGNVAEKHRCLPLFVEDDGAARYLYLGMEEPADLDTLDALQMRTGFEICPVLIGYRELDAGLRQAYGIGADADRSQRADEAFEIGGVVGPDCLRHGDEALAEPDPPEPDPEDSFEVGVTTPAAEPAETTIHPAAEVPTRRILQALTQLLVDKGVLTREELVAHVNALTERERG